MSEFKSGIERIVARSPVPVVPMALRGLWGSIFSRAPGSRLARIPRRLWSRIVLAVGDPVAPEDVDKDDLHARVLALRGEAR